MISDDQKNRLQIISELQTKIMKQNEEEIYVANPNIGNPINFTREEIIQPTLERFTRLNPSIPNYYSYGVTSANESPMVISFP